MPNKTDEPVSQEELRDTLLLEATRHRGEDGREFTQVTANCPCGRGGCIRLDNRPGITKATAQSNLELLDRLEIDGMGRTHITDDYIAGFAEAKKKYQQVIQSERDKINAVQNT